MYFAGLALWAGFLVIAFFYTRRARHPKARPLAAYLIFVIVFTVSSFVLFGSLTFLLQALDQASALSDPMAAALFLVVVFVPAFLVARWQLRKPPRRPRRP